LQAQLSSAAGAWSSSFFLPAASSCRSIWWKTPSSVPMISAGAGDSTARLMMPVVEAMKSACASTASSHSGWQITSASGWRTRSSASRFALNCSCTMQVPGQITRSGRFASFATQRPRWRSGANTIGWPSKCFVILTAFEDVQIRSLIAFTSAEVLMYVSTLWPG
jgi:hypothetical protein